MNRLIRAETKRYLARRITFFFPLILAGLMLGGVVIALLVITNGNDGFDFMNDVARSSGPTGPVTLLDPIASLLPVMAFVLGASYVGADLKAGVIEQLLTWEPRRLRLVGARLIGGGLTTALIAIVLAIWFSVLIYGLAAIVGTTAGIDGGFFADLVVAIGRAGIASALFFCIGLAVTLIVSSSVGSIVGFLIYWFIGESFLITAFLPSVSVWLPVTNAEAFASGGDVVYIEGSVFGEGVFEELSHHGYQTAGLYLVLWTLLFVVISGVWFNRRDID